MTSYKHTQIGYLTLIVTFVVAVLFVWLYSTAAAEPPSVDSGPNFLITFIMALVLFILASFWTLTVSVDERNVTIKFGYGIFRKKFAASEIAGAAQVKNHWYYGWGIHVWLWPYLWVYNVSGFDAVELRMKDGRTFRIGTDEPAELETAIKRAMHS